MIDKSKPIKKKRKLSDLTKAEINANHCCTNESLHENHMCYLARRRDIAKIVKIANNPKHICLICGRVANKEDNLCTPFEMM